MRWRLPQGALRDSLVLGSGLMLSQLLLWAALPLWARRYDSEAFAALGLWTSIVAMVSLALPLRYDSAIVPAARDAEAQTLLRLCLRLVLLGGGALALLAWIAPLALRQGLGLQALGPWLPLAVLAGAMAAAFGVGQAWANRQRDYARLSLVRLLMAALTVTLALALVHWEAGLLWAHALAALAGLALLRWPAGPSLRPGEAAAVAARHRAAPLYLWPAALLDTLTQQLPLWLILQGFGSELAGQFSLAWRALALPLLMAASAAGSVFYQRFAAAQDQPRLQRTQLLRAWRALGLLGLAPVALVLVAGPWLFTTLFGPAWTEAGRQAQLLAPMLWAMMCSSATSGALIVLGLQRWAPRFGLAMLVYRPAAIGLGARCADLALGLGLWVAAELLAILFFNLLIWRRLAARCARC